MWQLCLGPLLGVAKTVNEIRSIRTELDTEASLKSI